MPASPLELLLLESNQHAKAVERASKAQDTRSAAVWKHITPPQALVMIVVDVVCECGHEYRFPNPHILVRYDDKGNQHSVHYRRREAASFLALPREVKHHQMSVPFCLSCFQAGPAPEKELARPVQRPQALDELFPEVAAAEAEA